MEERRITEDMIEYFSEYLQREEKAPATIEKYIRDIKGYANYAAEGITKESVTNYKEEILMKHYAPRSINSMISSLNSFFDFMDWRDCKVKSIKIQNQIYRPEEQELTKQEYTRLVKTAIKLKKERLALILQTICSTGIRVSELKYITVSAVKKGRVTINMKGKVRTIFILNDLCKKILYYAAKYKIEKGEIFLTKFGNSISRTNLWKEMKELSKKAGVDPEKTFPHNLRHLFARTFYRLDKDIAKLADVLGHSSINTTRIYIMTTGEEHRRRMEEMRLLIT